MEEKFFPENHESTYIFGDKPSCFDHILYQELLTAMIISGNGKRTELFTTDSRFRLYSVQRLTKWYNRMAYQKVS